MRRTFLLIILCLTLVQTFRAAPTTGTSGAAAPATVPLSVDALIEQLGDPEPSARQDAADKLAAMGYRARPALVKAAQSSSPQVASRASELLMPLPWWVLNDPVGVREQLLDYGQANNDERKRRINLIALLPGSERALFRLMQEEPSDDVSWQAMGQLRMIDDPNRPIALRKMNLTEARPQLLALAALAYLPVDHKKGLELLGDAIDADEHDDGTDNAEIVLAYQLLVTEAIEAGDLKQATDLLRTRARNSAAHGDATGPVFRLLVLHADHQSDGELQDDLQEFAPYIGAPESMYALAKIEAAKPDASNMLIEAISRSALACSLASVESHDRVATRCIHRAWDSQARQEIYAMLNLDAQAGDAWQGILQVWGHQLLAHSAELHDDHPGVAAHLTAVLEACNKFDSAERMHVEPAKTQANIDWHLLRAARDAGDKAAAEKLVTKLLETPDPDSDVAIEVVGYLRETGRSEEAKHFFQKAYDAGQADLVADRTHAAQSLNNLAWMCARCGERTDEAIKLAQRALTLEPDTYAYLDTTASAYFAAGDSARATRLEKRALIMRPGDPFIQKQLAEFEKGERKKKSVDH